MPMMPFIGVRISWLMLARNSLLARLASSAMRLAASSSDVRSRTLRSRSARHHLQLAVDLLALRQRLAQLLVDSLSRRCIVLTSSISVATSVSGLGGGAGTGAFCAVTLRTIVTSSSSGRVTALENRCATSTVPPSASAMSTERQRVIPRGLQTQAQHRVLDQHPPAGAGHFGQGDEEIFPAAIRPRARVAVDAGSCHVRARRSAGSSVRSSRPWRCDSLAGDDDAVPLIENRDRQVGHRSVLADQPGEVLEAQDAARDAGHVAVPIEVRRRDHHRRRRLVQPRGDDVGDRRSLGGRSPP